MLIDQANITSAPAQIIAADGARRWVVLQNAGTADAFVKIAEDNDVEVTVDNGLRLIPGALLFLSAQEATNPARLAVRAVCNTSTVVRIQGGSSV